MGREFTSDYRNFSFSNILLFASQHYSPVSSNLCNTLNWLNDQQFKYHRFYHAFYSFYSKLCMVWYLIFIEEVS